MMAQNGSAVANSVETSRFGALCDRNGGGAGGLFGPQWEAEEDAEGVEDGGDDELFSRVSSP
jgi:hypothetical protein